MQEFQDKKVLVIGINPQARAVCALLRRHGARVWAASSEKGAGELAEAPLLEQLGVTVIPGATEPPAETFFRVIACEDSLLKRNAEQQGLLITSELELGGQFARCLPVAIGGTNGKSTTAQLITAILLHTGRKTVHCGGAAQPISEVVEESKDLDYLVVEADAFQLEQTHLFRPQVAVLTSLAPDHLDHYPSAAKYVLAHTALFKNQQIFDWAIIQKSALERLQSQSAAIPGKVITYSATDSHADLFLERGLLISRLGDWSGPLLDLETCRLRGPQNAENLMAALAVGHVLRVPLESMVEALKGVPAPPHCFQALGEVDGILFIDDAKCSNVDALEKALLGTRTGREGAPNVVLIAGGHDKGLDFHGLGPVLAARVKHAFLIGEASDKIRSAWSLFTPCTQAESLLEAVAGATKKAAPGDVVLLSPACSSSDQFRNYKHRGESFCEAVKSMYSGRSLDDHNINCKTEP